MISMTETSPDFRIGGRLRLLGEMHEIRLDHAIGQGPRFDGNCLYVTTQITAGIQQQVLQILRQFAKEVICDQVEQMASRHDVAYRTVKINSASSRWGSCSASGNLNFSWKLIMCAQPLIEYVVAHELAHRLHMNHSALFWREVERLCPDYQIRRKLLRIEAQRLRSWRKF